MCFTPGISLSTAIFEFIVATFILIYYKRRTTNTSIIILIYLLGLYQLSEYMLCTSNNPILWAKIGFISYTFLPALGLKFFLDYSGKKHNSWLVFAFPLIVSIFALLKDGFVVESSCDKYFVVVKYLFFNTMNILPRMIYGCYYFGFIVYIAYLITQHHTKTRNLIEKEIDIIFLIGIILSLVPALLLLFIFPSVSIQFPSIYCHFSVIFAICVLFGFYLDSKNPKKRNRKT